jgi:hypothetical protein
VNQAILFNDDHSYIADIKTWKFTGLMSGVLITIHIKHAAAEINQQQKFIWEDLVEDWLEDNEPDEDAEIWL